MNKELDNAAFLAGDSISENAVSGALEGRPRTLLTHAADGGHGQPTELPAAADRAALRASRSRRLRRWSVAELIVRAVARPPTGGVAH